jgi:hypothetical protein
MSEEKSHMTPEERARTITDQMAAGCSFDVCGPGMCACRDSISAAIRAAENAALERAARMAMEHDDNERSDFGAGASAAAERIAAAIRALKGDEA